MSRVLLTGGRAPATLELARLFHAAGHTVHVTDSWSVHATRFSNAVSATHRLPAPRSGLREFTLALARLCERARIEVLIPTCEDVFWVARAAPGLPGRTHVFTESPGVLRTLHDKGTFAQWCAALGLAVPRTQRLTSPAEAAALAPRAGELVFKPAYSRFGTQTLIRPSAAQVRALRPTPEAPWVAQQALTGPELCAYAVLHAGTVRALGIYPSRYHAGRASVHFEAAAHAGVTDWVTRFAQRGGHTGQFSFDFIDTPAGPAALECNPRLTSGVHLFRRQPELAAAFLDPAPRPALLPSPVRPAMLAAGMLSGGHLRSAAGRAAFRAAEDVLFTRADPRPGLMQPLLLAALVVRAGRHGTTLLGATTHDIEWNGEA